jgi:hypothetical protein
MNLTEFPPVLSWDYSSPSSTDAPESHEQSRATDYQIAYRILVSDSLQKLAADEGSHWDTGKLYSTQNRAHYGGKGLEPNKSYHWKVSTWGTDRLCSPFSEVASFSMEDAPGANLLLDGGYESDGYGWYGVTVTDRRVVTSESHGGKKSLEMRSNQKYGRRTYQDAVVEDEKLYLVETWLKMEKVPRDNVRLTVTWLKGRVPKGAPLEPHTLRQDTIACGFGTRDWTCCSDRLNAPKGARIVRFQITMDPTPAKATLWIDDNRLIEVGR